MITASPPDGPWVKARAVLPAIVACDAQIVCVADSDVWCEGLRQAVDAVRRGGNPWAMPHRGVFRLTESATERLIAGEHFEDLDLTQPAYLGTIGGGFVIAPRELLVDVRFDPRFVGWGQEDESVGMALSTLAGRPWRGKVPLVHLFHPPQDRATRRWGSVEARSLCRRYRRARADPRAMETLIKEIHELDDTDQPAGGAREPQRL